MDNNNPLPTSTPQASEPIVQPVVSQPTQTVNAIPPTSTAPQAIVTNAGGENKSKMWLIVIMVVIIVILVAVGGYLYMNKETAVPTPVTQTQTDVTTQTAASDAELLQKELDEASASDSGNDMSEADQNLQSL